MKSKRPPEDSFAVMLPVDLITQVEEETKRLKLTPGEITRMALERYFEIERETK